MTQFMYTDDEIENMWKCSKNVLRFGFTSCRRMNWPPPGTKIASEMEKMNYKMKIESYLLVREDEERVDLIR